MYLSLFVLSIHPMPFPDEDIRNGKGWGRRSVSLCVIVSLGSGGAGAQNHSILLTRPLEMVDCTVIYNCLDCVAQAGCGWCYPANCVAGTALGPSLGSCSSYKYKVRSFRFPTTLFSFYALAYIALVPCQSCYLSTGAIGGIIGLFVGLTVAVIICVMLVCWCKCKRGAGSDKPVSTRDFELQEHPELAAHPVSSQKAPEAPKHIVTDARRQAMEEKYGRSFNTKK